MLRAISTMTMAMAIGVMATGVMALCGYGLSSAVWAAASSVDCAKAQTWAEQNICRNDELASLDTKMTAVFERLRDALSGEARSDQVFYQRGFLKGRDICRTQTQAITGQECLRRIYRDRIAELENYLAAVAVDPDSAPMTLNDCYANAANRTAIVSCLQLELHRVDADLKRVAENMRVRMQQIDTSARADISAERRFTSAQDAFLKFRQASCEWRAAAMAKDNGAEYTFLSCMVDLAHTRMVEIETLSSDWRPQKP